jgi:hypothetical protein
MIMIFAAPVVHDHYFVLEQNRESQSVEPDDCVWMVVFSLDSTCESPPSHGAS